MFDTFRRGLPRAGHTVGTPSAVPQLSWTRPRREGVCVSLERYVDKSPRMGCRFLFLAQILLLLDTACGAPVFQALSVHFSPGSWRRLLPGAPKLSALKRSQWSVSQFLWVRGSGVTPLAGPGAGVPKGRLHVFGEKCLFRSPARFFIGSFGFFSLLLL